MEGNQVPVPGAAFLLQVMNQNMAPRRIAATAADPSAVPALPPAESLPDLAFPELGAGGRGCSIWYSG
jgi:hypothetical protein